MKLLVLAGGYGTRLQSVVEVVSKPLAPIGGVPFLRLQIESWKSQGISSFVFLLHHRADLIIGFLQDEQKMGLLKDCELHYLAEATPLDTGGALAYAVQQLGLTGDFLVANADTWLGTSIVSVTQASSPAMAVVELTDASRYGRVQFDVQHRVTAFQEKCIDSPRPGWINAGLCKLNANSFKDSGHLPFSLERVTFPAMVARRELRAVLLRTEFIDIGIPGDYFRFCRWVAIERKGTL